MANGFDVVEAAACFEEDLCHCPHGPAPHLGGSALLDGEPTDEEEYEAYLREYREYMYSGLEMPCRCL